MKLLDLIISIIAGLFILWVQNKFEFLINWIKDIITWVKLNHIVIELAIPIIGAVITYFLVNLIEKCVMKYHFKHSSKALKKIHKSMHDSAIRNRLDDNKEMDKYILSPIEYAKETIIGNRVPAFYPDAPYQDILFNENIVFVVAITAENPNLWMDPTLCYYMANCYAVSLMRHAKKMAAVGKNKIVVKDYKIYKKEYTKERKTVLNSLITEQELKDFQFIRFFLYDKKQSECCKNTVFPSLKASQDLFRTLSFYILKDKFQEKRDWEDFTKKVNYIWSLFEKKIGKSQVLDIRKAKTIPEFLVLFYNNNIEIHTYLGGEHRKIDNDPDSEYYPGEDFSCDVKKLISYMAKYEKDNGDDLDDLSVEKKNQRNTFIVCE